MTTTNNFDISGQTVLVTGGARGIGLMIAEGLLRAGVTVLVSTRKADAAQEAQQELSQYGTVHAIAADISTEEGCRDLAEQVKSHTDHLDGLINNAGTTWGATFDEFPPSAWDKVLGVNVKTPFILAQLLRPLLEAGAGSEPSRIINIGSIDGLAVPNYENYSYSASKAAVHHMTRHMASTLAPSILVNAIAPGPFPTKMMKWAIEEHGDEMSKANPLGRLGRPEDAVGLVTFLLSPASSFITGTTIPLDGGLTSTMSVAMYDPTNSQN